MHDQKGFFDCLPIATKQLIVEEKITEAELRCNDTGNFLYKKDGSWLLPVIDEI